MSIVGGLVGSMRNFKRKSNVGAIRFSRTISSQSKNVKFTLLTSCAVFRKNTKILEHGECYQMHRFLHCTSEDQTIQHTYLHGKMMNVVLLVPMAMHDLVKYVHTDRVLDERHGNKDKVAEI